MPNAIPLFSLLVGAATAVPIVRSLRRDRRDPAGILALAFLPLAVGLAVWCGLEFARICALAPWSDARLAPTIGLWKGWPLYSPADAGPINGWLYGPVAALLWSPAALADTPTTALRIAGVIDVLLLALPLVLAATSARADDGARRWPIWSALLGIGLLPLFYPTWYALYFLNADAAAVALGATGCVLLATPGRVSSRRAHAAAAFTVLALWSKQVECLLPAAQLLWLALGSEAGAARRYLGPLLIWILGLSALFVIGFGPDALWYNMWTVPAHHPIPGGLRAWGGEAAAFFLMTLPLWAALAGFGLLLRRGHPSATRRLSLFVYAALALLPLGAMASAKLGADRNSLHSVYYLIVAVVVALAQLGTSAESRLTRGLRWLLPAGALAALLVATRQVSSNPDFDRADTSAEAFTFAQERRGQVYFPWNPLAMLMADGAASHFEYGVIDRLYAGAKLTPARLVRDLLPGLRWIAYPKSNPAGHVMQQQLPQFARAQALEHWILYSVPPPGSPSP